MPRRAPSFLTEHRRRIGFGGQCHPRLLSAADTALCRCERQAPAAAGRQTTPQAPDTHRLQSPVGLRAAASPGGQRRPSAPQARALLPHHGTAGTRCLQPPAANQPTRPPSHTAAPPGNLRQSTVPQAQVPCRRRPLGYDTPGLGRPAAFPSERRHRIDFVRGNHRSAPAKSIPRRGLPAKPIFCRGLRAEHQHRIDFPDKRRHGIEFGERILRFCWRTSICVDVLSQNVDTESTSEKLTCGFFKEIQSMSKFLLETSTQIGLAPQTSTEERFPLKTST